MEIVPVLLAELPAPPHAPLFWPLIIGVVLAVTLAVRPGRRLKVADLLWGATRAEDECSGERVSRFDLPGARVFGRGLAAIAMPLARAGFTPVVTVGVR